MTANFAGLVSAHADALPLTLDVCLDQDCVSATVQLGTQGGEGCPAAGQGTPCCTFDPAAPGAMCDAQAGTVDVSLPVPDAGAFAGAIHTVEVTVRGQDGQVLISGKQATLLQAFQPNGPDCEPACFDGTVQFPAQ